MEKKFKEAMERGNMAKLKKLIDKVSHGDVKWYTSMAVYRGSCEVLENLPRSWFWNDYDRPLMHIAVTKRHVGICNCLLGIGLDPNTVDVDGNTALYIACIPQRINKPIIRALMENGANPHLPNQNGQSTLNLLERKREEKIIDLIKLLYATSAETQYHLKRQVDKLEEKVEEINCNMASILSIEEKFDYLATKEDVQSIANGAYVSILAAKAADGNCPLNAMCITERQISKRDKEQVYSYLDCDFLESNETNTSRRGLSPEEEQHIKSKLTYIIGMLKCHDTLLDIADRLYAKEAMNDEQMQQVRCPGQTVKEIVRYMMINIIISGGKLFRFLAFVDALKDLGEEKMARILMTRDSLQQETVSVKL